MCDSAMRYQVVKPTVGCWRWSMDKSARSQAGKFCREKQTIRPPYAELLARVQIETPCVCACESAVRCAGTTPFLVRARASSEPAPSPADTRCAETYAGFGHTRRFAKTRNAVARGANWHFQRFFNPTFPQDANLFPVLLRT